MNDKLRNLLSEAFVARDMGLVESVKQSVHGWANMASVYQAMLINTFLTLLGLVIVFAGSATLYTIGGGITIALGLFGLINNVRFAL